MKCSGMPNYFFGAKGFLLPVSATAGVSGYASYRTDRPRPRHRDRAHGQLGTRQHPGYSRMGYILVSGPHSAPCYGD